MKQRAELEEFNYADVVILPNGETFRFDVKQSGTPVGGGGKDVAVLKIEVTNAPVLKLGESRQVQLQDSIIVIGYPNTADVISALSDKSIFEASVLQGQVSNTSKTLQDNAPVLQISTTVAPGSSGSPVLNQNGEVVGMITFGGGAVDEETSFPFAIPTSTIQEYIRQSGASNEVSTTTALYQEGLKLYWRGDWEGAKAKFLAVQGLFPQHSEVSKLIRASEQKIAEAWDKRSYTLWFIAGISIVILLLIAYLLGRRRYAPLVQVESASSTSTTLTQAEEFSSRADAWTNIPRAVTKLFRPETVVSFQPFLEVRNHQGQIKRFYLQNNQHKLGRDPNWADLCVPDAGWEVISKCHATLYKDGENYRIYDGDRLKGSTNKTRIDGIEISKNEGYLLHDEDKLTIGDDPRNQVTLTYFNPSDRSRAQDSARAKTGEHST
ncbi:MAG: trypsin-like peptidase domain-containing protein [Oculatellaceae cyanobacterium bins.114]|nr:trypsin-like peptidase domain-containing protein [Oculatellaceae cyanobacterium bins.114]